MLSDAVYRHTNIKCYINMLKVKHPHLTIQGVTILNKRKGSLVLERKLKKYETKYLLHEFLVHYRCDEIVFMFHQFH